MNKTYNKLLIGGICAIIVGIALLCYSIRSYSEIKYLNNKIDFDELDNNMQIPTSDKYYKHLSIADFLNQKLEKNKNLPIKNTSCAYLDYQQHNILSLYRLIYKTANDDSTRKSVVEGNMRSYIKLMDSYKTCRKYSEYKAEIQSKIEEIEKTDNLMIENRMDAFLNSGRIIPSDMEENIQEGEMQPVNEGEIQPIQNEQNNPQKPEIRKNENNDNNNSTKNSDELIQPYLQ